MSKSASMDEKDEYYERDRSKDSKIWRYARLCCCRYGWYPVFVAPVVTAACILDLYSSFGCDFLKVDVGFTPSNEGWNTSSIDLGLFRYQSYMDIPDDHRLHEALFDGCRDFSDTFEDFFVSGDKTWTVARIMSYISGISGMAATATIWLMILTPLPACFFWAGSLLPAVMVGFLAEGSKFLFFDTQICHGSIWYPIGENNIFPRTAETCTLGETGIIAIASGCCFLVSLLMVCLKVPKRRELDEMYGLDYGSDEDDEEESVENSVDAENIEAPNVRNIEESSVAESTSKADPNSMPDSNQSMEEGSAQEGAYNATPQVAAAMLQNQTEPSCNSYSSTCGVEKEIFYDYCNKGPWLPFGLQAQAQDTENVQTGEGRDDASAIASERSGVASERSAEVSQSTDKMKTVTFQVSESRLKTAKDMEIKQKETGESEELIDKCIADLEKSFEGDDSAKIEVFEDEGHNLEPAASF